MYIYIYVCFFVLLTYFHIYMYTYVDTGMSVLEKAPVAARESHLVPGFKLAARSFAKYVRRGGGHDRPALPSRVHNMSQAFLGSLVSVQGMV